MSRRACETIHCPFSKQMTKAFERAERDARTMMDAAGVGWLSGAPDEDWIAAFGDTEGGLRDLKSGLARRYHRSSCWRHRKLRHDLRERYIAVYAMLTVAYGCTVVWH